MKKHGPSCGRHVLPYSARTCLVTYFDSPTENTYSKPTAHDTYPKLPRQPCGMMNPLYSPSRLETLAICNHDGRNHILIFLLHFKIFFRPIPSIYVFSPDVVFFFFFFAPSLLLLFICYFLKFYFFAFYFFFLCVPFWQCSISAHFNNRPFVVHTHTGYFLAARRNSIFRLLHRMDSPQFFPIGHCDT